MRAFTGTSAQPVVTIDVLQSALAPAQPASPIPARSIRAGFVMFDVGGGWVRYKWLQGATRHEGKLGAMRLRLGTSRLRAVWPTHVGLRLVFGLFGSGLAVLIALTLLVNAVTIPACEAATPTPPDHTAAPFAFDPEARARTFAQAMASNEFETAYEMVALGEFGSASLCELNLEQFWRAVAQGHTSLLSVEQSSPLVYSAVYDTLSVRLRLTLSVAGESDQPDREAYVGVLLAPDGRITSYAFHSVLTHLGPPPEIPSPPYAAPDSFEAFQVTVGQAPWELGGTLTMPRGAGPFAAVVILGPNDRDGTQGANKRDRDIAQGLAAQGVAVLRYDGRARAHALDAARQPRFTIADESVDDALAAVELLRRTPRVDPAKIYLLGIGYTSFAAPRAAHLDAGLAGMILISPSAGLIWDWAWRAQQERAEVDEVVTAQEAREIDVLKTRAAAIAAIAAGNASPDDLGARIDYHLNLVTYKPEQAVRTLRIPILALFGDRDGVVPIEDHEAWISNLLGRPDAAIRVYEGHSHGMFDVRKMSGPELRLEGHVDEEVVIDIAAWIEGDWPQRSCREADAWYAGCHGG